MTSSMPRLKPGLLAAERITLLLVILWLPWTSIDAQAQTLAEQGALEAHATRPDSRSIRYFILYGEPGVTSLPDSNTMPHGMPTLRHISDPADPWFAMDKLQHAAFSFFITTGTQYGLVNKLSLSEKHALPLSVGTSALAGISKEVVDMKRASNPYFSYRDLVADGAGIILAIGLILI